MCSCDKSSHDDVLQLKAQKGRRGIGRVGILLFLDISFLLNKTHVITSALLGALVPGKAEAERLRGEGATCESACSLLRF